MTADERLALIELKIKRAEKHIIDLNAAIGAFLNSRPYRWSSKRNPDTRQLIYYITSVEPVPDLIAVIVGDVLQNLRSALDHLANQLYEVNGGRSAKAKFPIGDTPNDFKTGMNGIKKLVRKDAVAALQCVEAYKGGKGHELWALHRLNNIDKHRLVVAVGSSLSSVEVAWTPDDLPAHVAAKFGVDFRISSYYKPIDTLCPLKAGDHLFTNYPDAKHDEKQDFRFDVAFNEIGIAQGKAILETVQHIADVVRNTVRLFKPCLA